MIAYKGFLPGLICRGYQFRMGLNVTEKANCAHNGFHCAEDPLDCLRYYGDILIYDDGAPYSFFFEEVTPRGTGICGGIILHGADNLQKAQYSVHT